MKLNVMREFVHLAKVKNFNRTAEELYIAQSALSRHIVSLEQEMNTTLITRTRNSFELTSAGEIALEHFQRILEEYELLLDEITQDTEAQSGTLHLGILYYDKDYYVSQIRDTFRRKYPNVQLILHSGQPAQLEADLYSGRLDAAIIYGSGAACRWDVNALPFLKIPFSLIYDQHHRFHELKDIRVDDLNDETLLQPAEPLQLADAKFELSRMLEREGASHVNTMPIYNFDEVGWQMQDTGAVYISPMINPQAFGETTESRYLMPEKYQVSVSVMWLKTNSNPAVKQLCSAVKMCYP